MADSYDKITVIKRDGAREQYDPDKIIQVAEAAGLDTTGAVRLAQEVTVWVTGLRRTEVTSIEIRDQVQKVLNTLNSQVADLYRWYQKTKG